MPHGSFCTQFHSFVGVSIPHLLNDLNVSLFSRHTEMEIRFPESEVIGLNAVNMTIGSVSVNDEPADFECFEQSTHIEDGERWCSVSCCTTAADAACSTYISSLDKEMVPNLFISCRKTVNTLTDQNNLANGGGKLQSTEDHINIPNGHLDHDFHQVITESGSCLLLVILLLNVVAVEFKEMVHAFGFSCRLILVQNVKLVRINYQVDANESCIHFESNLLCTENQIRRARCWFPCMDNSSQCSWYVYYIPHYTWNIFTYILFLLTFNMVFILVFV